MQRTSSIGVAGVLALVALAAGCSQGSAPKQNSVPVGTLLQDPANSDGFSYFLADGHFNGKASQLVLERVVWGRLVDLFARDPASGITQKVMRDLLVDPNIDSDGSNYRLDLNPVTLREELVIQHAFGTPAFEAAFQPLRDEVGLGSFIDKGLSANEFPPFTAVPRNATVALHFNDLLDPASVNGANVKILTGLPPTAPFEARVVPDRSHGGLVNGVMRSTRVLVDTTISTEDATQLGLKVNTLGLPASTNPLLVNIGLRIPTVLNPSAAQFSLLRNLTGHPASFTDNGPADSGSPTLDVVRGFRSGGTALATGDAFNGFLVDNNPPAVMATQQVLVESAVGPLAPGVFRIQLTFAAAGCAMQPRVGDLITVQNGVLRTLNTGQPLVGATVSQLLVRRIDETGDIDEAPSLGTAEFRTPWDSGLGFDPGCFVSFNPGPEVVPLTGVPSTATVRISFSEPMDPNRTNGFDGIEITDPTVPVNQPLSRTVVGRLVPIGDLTSFVFEPSMPFSHTAGGSETFNLEIISFKDQLTKNIFGVTDLAGNVLGNPFPQVSFTLKTGSPALATGSVSLRFNNLDEDGNGFPEVRGQVVPDLARGVMQSRAVVRFSAFADPSTFSSPSVQAITPLGGVAEPLSIYGSRTMTSWRYVDLGLPFLDDEYLNLDVEGLAWMVAGTGVQLDNFPEFELSVAHSRFATDESINIMTGNPNWPSSGLTSTFASNVVVGDTLYSGLAPKSSGYLIQSLDQFKTPSDTLMVPFPINRNQQVKDYSYWTWRDTANQALGGPFSGGVPPGGAAGSVYPANAVPTLGLPLLMDFKTFPAPTQAQGINRLFIGGVNFGINLPFFRAHSTGGIDPNQQQVLIDPDGEVSAKGGLDQLGNPTPGLDNGFYYGNADFVTRVSQMHTIWLDTGVGSKKFNSLVSIPAVADVPAGLELKFKFRGATQVTPAGPAAQGTNLDPYGNPKFGGTSFSVIFLNGDDTWKDSLSELNGARFIQIRVTMVANAETSAVPEVDAIGFSYSE